MIYRVDSVTNNTKPARVLSSLSSSLDKVGRDWDKNIKSLSRDLSASTLPTMSEDTKRTLLNKTSDTKSKAVLEALFKEIDKTHELSKDILTSSKDSKSMTMKLDMAISGISSFMKGFQQLISSS